MVVSVLGIVSLLYLLVNGPISAGIVALCFGLGLGGLTTVPSVAIANFYGRNSLGSIRGINEISIGGGQAAGAIFSGIIYDMTNSYNLVFPTLSIMALISALAFLFVKPPQK
jgi:MFS family permease